MPKISVGGGGGGGVESFSVSLISRIEKVWIRGGGGGVSRFSVENFLSHSAENFRRGILYCCNNFGYRKSFDKGRGSITIFRRSFCLTVPEYFIGEHFGVSEKFFYRKFSCIGGRRGITVLSKFFVSQDRNEKLCKGTLLFSGNFLVSKKKLEKRGLITFFSRNFYVSQCRKRS